MTSVLKSVLVLCVLASVISVAAEDTNPKRDTFALAQRAIDLQKEEKHAEAQAAFNQFQLSWNRTQEEPKPYDKKLYILAADCFLRFGDESRASELLYEVMENTGVSLPPEAPYLLVKSLYASGAYSLATEVFRGSGVVFKGLDRNKQQEVTLMAGQSYLQLGQFNEAEATITQAASILPNNEKAREANSALQKLKDAKSGHPACISPSKALYDVLSNERSGSRVKSQALLVLAKTGDTNAYVTIVQATRSKDTRMRCAAATALGRYGDPKALEILQQITASDGEDKSVRERAALAIRQLQGH